MFFILVYVSPLQRENAVYYEPLNIFFIVDNNSEIFFDVAKDKAQKRKQSEALDLTYIIKKTIRDIGEKITSEDSFKYATSWWRFWRYLPPWLYESQRYKLNFMSNYFIHSVSGAGRGYEKFSPLKNKTMLKKDVKRLMGQTTSVYREPRLIIPQEEVGYIIQRFDHNISEHEDKSIIMVFPVSHLLEVKRWVLSWGSQARVLAPNELIVLVKEELQQALDYY